MKNSDLDELVTKIGKINEREPDVAQAISMVIDHIAGTYDDKYEKDENNPVITKRMLYNLERGGFLNIYQALRYLQRYISTGEKKSYLVTDIFKTIHYLVFELTRRIKKGDIEITEFKN